MIIIMKTLTVLKPINDSKRNKILKTFHGMIPAYITSSIVLIGVYTSGRFYKTCISI